MIPKKKDQSVLDIAEYDKQYNQAISGDKDMTTQILTGHLLRKYNFGLIDTGAGGNPLAVYDTEKGIYTIDEETIEYLIYKEYEDISVRELKEVYKKLTLSSKGKGLLKLNHDKNLIPVDNGIYDLSKHKLLPFSPKYVYLTKAATKYNPDISEPNIHGWKPSDWINTLASGDDEVTTLLWQVIQASLNGSYSYRKSIWLKGVGNDGKGTYQRLIMNMVGAHNVASLKANEFSGRFAMASLVGKTVVIGDDVQAGIYLDDSSNFNSVVTGDVVTIDIKNRQAFSMVLTPTVIQSTNGMPRFKNNTNGTFRRLVIVPFSHHFSDEEDNKSIKDDYINRTEVVEWVMRNALDNYSFTEFVQPDLVKNALEEFKVENDPLANFKVEVYDKHQPQVIPAGAVYRYYVQYQRDNGQRNIMTQMKFTREFSKLISDQYEKKKYRADSYDWEFSEFKRTGFSELAEQLNEFKDTDGSIQCYVKMNTPSKINN